MRNINIVNERHLVCRKNDDDYCIGDSYNGFRIITRTVSGLLRERFQDYYENGFRIITRTVSGLLRERFQINRNGFRLLQERFQIITGTVSDYYENGFRLL